MHELLIGVAAATRKQTKGIGQIGRAVQDPDQVTQQNASLVEQTAAASSAMRAQAHALVKEVSRFHLPLQRDQAAAPGV